MEAVGPLYKDKVERSMERMAFLLLLGLFCLSHAEICEIFTCSNGRCVPPADLCNGHDDCGDNSDETDDSCANCTNLEFPCENYVQCVLISKVCDNKSDCSDGSDEGDCNEGCRSDQFACKTTDICISKSQLCDKFNDCEDNSDEDNCGRRCRSDQFTCKTTDICISKSQLCDKFNDCGDNSDEDNCEKKIPSIFRSTTTKSPQLTVEVTINEIVLKESRQTVPVYVLVFVTLGCLIFVTFSIGLSVAFVSWKFKKRKANQVTPSLPNLRAYHDRDPNTVFHTENLYDYADIRNPALKDGEGKKVLMETKEKRKLPDPPKEKEEDSYIYPENYYSLIQFEKEYINADVLKLDGEARF